MMTLRAARVIAEADVIAYHCARHGRSIARSIAAPHLRPEHIEERLMYPVTVETTDHPGGYRGALDDFYEQAAARLAAHLDAGRTVAVLAEGDPFFYGSYQHMHKRLAHRYPTEVVPGVTSISAAAARLGTPLCEAEEVLTVIPGTLPEEELTARLASTDSAVVMKLGRTFPAVRRAMESSGRLAEARYVERATMSGERTGPLADIDPESVPYFSVAVVPSRIANPRPAPGKGEVVVVGTGPAGPLWLTPETKRALADADELVGYTTYVDRVPQRPGQIRHGSDNKVESERAEFALDLARRGRRVAVVLRRRPGRLSPWRPPCWRWRPRTRTRTFRYGSSRASPPPTPPPRRPVRRSATTTRCSRCPTGSSRGRSSSSGWSPTAPPTWCSPCTTPVPAARTWQVGKAREVLLGHRAPDTPVVLGRDIGGPEESVRIVRLGELDPAQVDMRTILLIGSSQTQVVRRGDGHEIVWTPRRYPE
ncbi:precorrin-3B C17-methyltransferase [Streptomyces pristinaespiralis ATCC 25486]|uniref:Precorrin-3B C17-methyltransferase n=1 Tax=Streptomyces pristinaespiralis (strain ATCC 25486 / DSM 40338 / CBS 914.69 / JCM 4507 / KCC S-0507 / NBRC 13074 / NRRL 2958 / 5647) TaxID=457429 RepID=D6X7V5_STRE2|nr:precorrin-3B C17-methyltransferase [Streptomyces pristinaespiralis ATCC 25486]